MTYATGALENLQSTRAPPPPPPPPELAHVPAEELAALKANFDALDTDGDGIIGVAELRTALTGGAGSKAPRRPTEAYTRQVLASYDANGDGVVSFTEYVKALGYGSQPQLHQPLAPPPSSATVATTSRSSEPMVAVGEYFPLPPSVLL